MAKLFPPYAGARVPRVSYLICDGNTTLHSHS